MSVALGKLNAPWGIEVIAFSENVRETFGASVNKKAPEGGKVFKFLFLMKVTSWSLGNFDASWLGILVITSLPTTLRPNKGLMFLDEKPSNILLNLASFKDPERHRSEIPPVPGAYSSQMHGSTLAGHVTAPSVGVTAMNPTCDKT